MRIMCVYVVILILCGSHLSMAQPLEHDALLKKYFSVEELAELDCTRIFFNEQMLDSCEGSQDTKVCYQQFFDYLSKKTSLDSILSYEQQWKFYPDIDRQLFNSIWSYSAYKANELSSVKYYNAIDYNPTGKYRKFLKEVSEAEPYFTQYVESIETSGTLSPYLLDGFVYDPSGLYFKNARHQLILAIPFMTFNDRMATSPY